jgi:hypothetical protein
MIAINPLYVAGEIFVDVTKKSKQRVPKKDRIPEPVFSQKLQKEVIVVDDPAMYQRALEKGEGKTVYYDAEVSHLKLHSPEAVRQVDMVKQVFPEAIIINVREKWKRKH